MSAATSKLARRYARALSEVCDGAGNHAVIGKQLEAFASTWASSSDLQGVLLSPIIDLGDKRQILIKLFKKSLFAPTTQSFLLVLLDNGRIGEIEGVTLAFRDLMDEAQGRMRATVVTPTPLERAELTRIQAALQRLTGKTILLEPQLDIDLVGGAKVRLGNLELDATLQTHLDNLRARLLS